MKPVRTLIVFMILASASLSAANNKEIMRLQVGTIERLAAGVDGDVFGSGEKGESTVYMGSSDGWHSFHYSSWFEDKVSGQMGSSQGKFRCNDLKLISVNKDKEISSGLLMRVLRVDTDNRTVYLDSSAIEKMTEKIMKEMKEDAEQGSSHNVGKRSPLSEHPHGIQHHN